MLQIRTNYELDSSLASKYKYIDRTVAGSRNSMAGYVYETSIESVLMPVVYNDFDFIQETYIDENFERINTETFKNKMLELCNKQEPTIAYTRVLVRNIDNLTYDNIPLDRDMFRPVSDAVQSLYNKCMVQTAARETNFYYDNLKMFVFQSRVGNHIISIQNYQDYNQQSDAFLTIGLLPVFFPNFREKLTESELDFFKGLVNRSQVKRIANNVVTELFRIATAERKYVEKLNQILLKKNIQNILDNRLRVVRRKQDEAMSSASNYLEHYYNSLRLVEECTVQLRALEGSTDTFKEEIEQVMNLEGVHKIDCDTYGIYITYLTQIKYFEIDEAELIIRHETGFMKWLFTKLFIEQSYKIHIAGRLKFSIDPSNSNSRNFYSSPDWQFYFDNSCYFNPHLQHYTCFGDYGPKLVQAQASGDILLFANIGLATVRSLNFKDGTVLGRFKRDIESTLAGTGGFENVAMLEDNDGNRLTVREAMTIYNIESEAFGVEETTD